MMINNNVININAIVLNFYLKYFSDLYPVHFFIKPKIK